MEPSWRQNRSKLGCWFERCFLMYVGPFFIELLTQHGMAEVAKIVDSSTFFYSFLIFCWCVVGMICWSFFDRFLINFGVENRSKIDQTSIKKAIKNMMRFWIDFGWLLDRFLVDFGPKLGLKLGPSWHQNSKNEGSKMMSKKAMQKPAAGRSATGGFRPLKNY